MYNYYNQLLGVEDATATLSTREAFAPFLERFAALVTTVGLENDFGTRLLHRHYTVGPGTAVVERCSVDDGERVLRSSVEPTSTDVPASTFAWVDSHLMPLEFSEDTALTSMRDLDPTFAAEWGSVVSAHGLDDLLGLIYLPRDYLHPNSEQTLLETSDFGASTLRLASRDDCQEGDITTVWTVEPSAACRPGNYCRGWSTCRRSGSPPNDRHDVSYGHDAGRGPHETS